MQTRSISLFHFTKNIEILFSILRKGFWPIYCLEDMSWHKYVPEYFIDFPMVCFCDIPMIRIQEHVGFYGKFGIGLAKECSMRNAMNPVMYFAQASTVFSFWDILFDAIANSTNDLSDESAHNKSLQPTAQSAIRSARGTSSGG